MPRSTRLVPKRSTDGDPLRRRGLATARDVIVNNCRLSPDAALVVYAGLRLSPLVIGPRYEKSKTPFGMEVWADSLQ